MLALHSAALGQSPNVSVEQLSQAAARLSSADDIRTAAREDLEAVAIHCADENGAVQQKLGDFMKYINLRMGPNFDKTTPRMALLDEIKIVLPLIRKGGDHARVCAGLVSPDNKSADFISYAATLNRGADAQFGALAVLYALSSTLRLTALTSAKSEALLANKKYDSTTEKPALMLARGDLDEAIKLRPKKKLYLDRAEIHKRLGDQAAADADNAKAATLSQ